MKGAWPACHGGMRSARSPRTAGRVSAEPTALRGAARRPMSQPFVVAFLAPNSTMALSPQSPHPRPVQTWNPPCGPWIWETVCPGVSRSKQASPVPSSKAAGFAGGSHDPDPDAEAPQPVSPRKARDAPIKINRWMRHPNRGGERGGRSRRPAAMLALRPHALYGCPAASTWAGKPHERPRRP